MGKKEKLFLGACIILASILRLWKLSDIPIHLTPDEASLGYNAFSVLKTGRDEYGQIFPIIFKSFGDYKPGLYVYSAIPFVAVFGLSEFSVRLPSALAGIASVWLIYLIANALIPEFKTQKTNIGLMAAFLLAINPWHVHFSRGAWEANLSLFLTLLGILFFLKGLAQKKLFIWSAAAFGLTLWTYQGAKLSTALTLFTLTLAYWPQFNKRKKDLLIPLLIICIVSLPIVFSLKSSAGRLKVFSLFSYRRSEIEIDQLVSQENIQNKDLSYYLFHSEILSLARNFLLRYANYYSGKFLLFEGDWSNPRHSTPYHGEFYIIDGLLFIIGVIYLIRTHSHAAKLLFAWLLLFPLPAALSRDSIQSVRSLNLVIPIILITSIGLGIGLKRVKYPILIVYLVLISRFVDLEFIHSPFLTGKYWFYGHKQVVQEITKIQSQYSKILVNQSFDQPYIFFLFYQKYDPAKWWPQANLSTGLNGDVGLISKLDNIEFRPLAWSGDKYLPNTLIVAYPLAVDPLAKLDPDVNLLKEITYPDKTTAFYIFETKK